MESVYFIKLIFIVVVNVFFFFSGVFLNSVVIISSWRSVQLQKKLCYFTIMVLSCCDFLADATNNSFMLFMYVLQFFTPPMLFVNCKLFVVVRKSRRNWRTSPEIRKTFSLMAPSTRTGVNLEPRKYFHGYAFRPRVTG